MENIIVWIDSSIKIEKKIIKLNKFLNKQFNKVLFVSKDKATAIFYKTKGFKILSIEESLKNLDNLENLDYDKIFPDDLDPRILRNIINFFSFKNKCLPNYLIDDYPDALSELSILENFWSNLLIENNISHGLVLNGISISSFSLALCLYKINKNLVFWENGLFPESLFINKSGVNAFSYVDKIEMQNSNSINPTTLDQLIKYLVGKFKNKPSILVTLQVDTDTNIKCFSPFFSVNDFVQYLKIQFQDKFFETINIVFRNHPKYKISKKFLKSNSFNNLKISDNTFDFDLKNSDIVITINSTTGFEAILNRKCLISFGNSYYSKFLRFKYIRHENKKIKVFIFNPNDKVDIKIRKILISSLQGNSLTLNKNFNEWVNIFNNVSETEVKPFFVNDYFNQYIFRDKIISSLPKKYYNLEFFNNCLSKIKGLINRLYKILF
tara:strand:+ start:310 stop:1623 length:1314 start_codon:yes stop_codon:yes gene_type:complete